MKNFELNKTGAERVDFEFGKVVQPWNFNDLHLGIYLRFVIKIEFVKYLKRFKNEQSEAPICI